MTIRQLNPYIHFNGDAEAAIRLYEQALGAKVKGLMRYGETPMPVPEEHKARVVHAEIQIGDHTLMLSDGPPQFTATMGSAYQVALTLSDDDALAKAFDALGEGGEVMMPLEDMFWGGRLGMLKDRFGVRWMLMRVPACTGA